MAVMSPETAILDSSKEERPVYVFKFADRMSPEDRAEIMESWRKELGPGAPKLMLLDDGAELEVLGDWELRNQLVPMGLSNMVAGFGAEEWGPRKSEIESAAEITTVNDPIQRSHMWSASMHYCDCDCPACASRAELVGKSDNFERVLENCLAFREARIAGGFRTRNVDVERLA